MAGDLSPPNMSGGAGGDGSHLHLFFKKMVVTYTFFEK